MSDVNRQWRLRSRPVGWVKESDFELHRDAVPAPGPGQALIRNQYLAFEPAMRGWIEDRPSYMPPVQIGEVMRGMTVGRVEKSNAPALRPGDLVQTMSGWQEWAVADAGVTKLPQGVDPTLALSVLGATGITAYFGILDVGQVKSGETVLVSGAAGATGSVVGQIAKLMGARAIGIAGGPDKCRWLTSEAGFDGAIDYKGENVAARLDALCPGGIDVYFDNVGGPTLDLVLARMRHGARIVLCGAISRYNEAELPPGPRNYFELTIKSARMQGFIVIDYLRRFPEAQEKLLAWVAEGKIAWQADVQQGFENAPRTFLRLFRGENIGKQLLKI
jgi:NADPH-dependent curcumin reductase CurA